MSNLHSAHPSSAGPAARFAFAMLAASALLLTAAPVNAATPAADPHWLPWLGCWQPVPEPTQPGMPAPAAEKPHVVCVHEEAGGAVLQTIAEGKTIGETHIVTDGKQHPVERQGCSGWDKAQWSNDGARLFLDSELSCGAGLKRASSGVMSITDRGQWLEIQALGTPQSRAIHVQRYQPADASSLQAAGVGEQPASSQQLAIETARQAASAPMTPADVAEASHLLPAEAVEALLMGHRDRFDLDAATLAKLADAGVPGSVTDMMIALSYPDRFAVNPAVGNEQERGSEVAANPDGGRVIGPIYPGSWDPSYGCGYPSGVYGGYYGGYNSCGYSAAYSPWGYGSPYGYGYWYNRPPVIIINPGNDNTGEDHSGKAVKGRGYTRRGHSSDDGNGGVATEPRAPRSSSGSRPTVSPTRSPAPSPASSSGGGEVRHAKPRGSH